MNRSMIPVLLAGAMLAACSSKGEAGPVGPSGPRGEQGLQGAPGQPGESVLSAQLSVGSVDCPSGGSQFSSVSGTTFACNGADGPPGAPGATGGQGAAGPMGPQGPAGVGAKRLVVKTADGSLIGPILDFSEAVPAGGYVKAYDEAAGVFVRLDVETGLNRSPCFFVYESADCSGLGLTANATTTFACAYGSRLFKLAAATRFDILSHSASSAPGACNPEGGPGANSSGYPAVEVFDARYPYAAPLQVVLE